MSRLNTYGTRCRSLVVVILCPDHHRVAVNRLRPNQSLAPSAAVSLAACVQREARSPGVAREHVRTLLFLCRRHKALITSVTVDRHAKAELVTPRASPRSAWQPASSRMRVAGRGVVRSRTAAGSLSFHTCDHHRVAVDRHAEAELVTPSIYVQGQFCNRVS